MRLWVKLLLAGIIAFALFIGAVHVFLNLRGKSILTRQLELLTKRKVSIAYFGVTPPLNVHINDLDIRGLLKIKQITVSPSIIGLLTGNLVLNDIAIIRPEVNFENAAPLKTDSAADKTSRPETKAGPRKHPKFLIFKRLSIKDGSVNFTDRNVGANEIKLNLRKLNLNINNLYMLPRSIITNFELSGRIPWQEAQEEGKIEAEGWIDLFKRDIQATLKVEDIDGIALYPYYSNWVDLEKARIEKAKLNFTSNIQGLNNDVTAACHLELAEIVRKPRPEGEPEEKAERITSAVLDIFKALNQGKIVLDFTIRTKMDQPAFGFGDIRMAFEDKLTKARKGSGSMAQDVLMFPVKFLEGAFKGATDVTKAVVIGTINAGKEIKNTVEDSFKKEKKE